MLNIKHGSCEYQFLVFDLTRRGIEPESTVWLADALSTRPPIGEFNSMKKKVTESQPHNNVVQLNHQIKKQYCWVP